MYGKIDEQSVRETNQIMHPQGRKVRRPRKALTPADRARKSLNRAYNGSSR